MNTMMTKTLMACLFLFPVAGFAQHFDYADVLSVTPVYRTVQVTTPRQECWTEQVVHRSRPNHGGMILGGLIGGAIGNQFGRGDGKKASIAIGTLMGAGIGQQLSNQQRQGYVTQEQRCQTINSYHTEERLEGYRGKYIYNGSIYHTRTAADPGEKIRVKVTVEPVR